MVRWVYLWTNLVLFLSSYGYGQIGLLLAMVGKIICWWWFLRSILMVVMAGALSPPPISPLASSSLVDSSFPLLGIFSCQMVSFLAFGCRIWSWRLIFRSTSKEFYLSRYYLAYPIWRSLYILLATVGYILVRVLVDLFSCEIITALSVSLYTSLYT